MEAKIKVLEEKFLQIGQDSSQISKELVILRTQYNEITNEKAAANLLRLKQQYYDHGKSRTGFLLGALISRSQKEQYRLLRTIAETL